MPLNRETEIEHFSSPEATVTYSVNFYPLTHPILAKTKNQILLFFPVNTCKKL